MTVLYPPPQGILLVKELIDAYGLEVVQAYMGHIQVQRLQYLHPNCIICCMPVLFRKMPSWP